MRPEFSQLESLAIQLLETAKTINLSSVQMDKHHEILNDLQNTQEGLIADIESLSGSLMEKKPFAPDEEKSWDKTQGRLQQFIQLNQEFFNKFKEINDQI